jgi:antagonist of KipI
MDTAAARLINILLGNDENDAVIEMHFPAPRLVFGKDAVFAIGGGNFSPTINDRQIGIWRQVTAKKGDVLRFNEKSSGNRSYLSIKGGLKTDLWMGSSSTNMLAGTGGVAGRKLNIGDRIEFKRSEKGASVADPRQISASIIPKYSSFPTVRITPGAEFEQLSKKSRAALFSQDYTISQSSDRMGYRLAGGPLKLTKPREMVSSSVSFGTVQLLPDGQLITLMADHQTSGGYPRLAHVACVDLPLLAQLGANDKVAFHLIDIHHSENLAQQFERDLNFLRVACRFHSNPD